MDNGITLFVSCINYEATEEDIRGFFVEGGYMPQSVRLAKDRGSSRGFAFLEFKDRDLGLSAIADMDGQELMGRRLNVREADDRSSRYPDPRQRSGRMSARAERA